MEVRCSSCSTEYEFDDALVSARGTSVKCTNCGHQFRVHPVGAQAAAAAETWVVRDAAGKETTFTSLRDLQQGIVKGLIDPRHELSHGGQPFRRMEDIYELQTFFAVARQRKAAPRTLLGVGKDGAVPSRQSAPPPRRRGTEPGVQGDRITPVAGIPAVAAAPPTPEVRASMPTPNLRGSPEAAPRTADAGSRAAEARSPTERLESPSAPRARSKRDTDPPQRPKQLPWQQMEGLHGEPESEEFVIRKGVGLRWIVALVVLGGLALVAGTVGREYFLGFIRPKAEARREDARIPGFLEQARAAIARGDLDAAQGEITKARAIAPNDPQSVVLAAKLALTRAERTKQQLSVTQALELPPEPADKAAGARKKTEAEIAADVAAATRRASERKTLETALQTQLTEAKTAIGEAFKLAPQDPDVLRARVDAARLDGQLKDARALVAALSAQAGDPENAFSLGALDLAEGASGYASAVDRLRVAARAEEGLGKARALLIQALLGSGDVAAARAELDKLSSLAPQHPGLPGLRAMVESAQSTQLAASGTVKPDKAAPPPRQPAPAARPPAEPARERREPAAAAETGSDPIARARTLHRQGDLIGAEKLYQSVLDQDPNSIPALSGLGDIARQKHATATAAAYYDRILEQDQNHLPTLMARGDMYWHSGNRVLAVALYRRALGQVGSTDPLGQRALRRIEEFDRGGAAQTDTPEPDDVTETPDQPSKPVKPAAGSDDVPITDEAGREIKPSDTQGGGQDDSDDGEEAPPPSTPKSKTPVPSEDPSEPESTDPASPTGTGAPQGESAGGHP